MQQSCTFRICPLFSPLNSSLPFALQIMIFPEGTCTNRSCLITFKPGNSSCTSSFLTRVKVVQHVFGFPRWLVTAQNGCWAVGETETQTWPCSSVWHIFAGAFIPAVPVQPVVIRYPNTLVSFMKICYASQFDASSPCYCSSILTLEVCFKAITSLKVSYKNVKVMIPLTAALRKFPQNSRAAVDSG